MAPWPSQAAQPVTSTQGFEAPATLTWGGPGRDGARKMISTADGGFLMGGWQAQRGYHETGSGFVWRLSPEGVPLWQRTLRTNNRNQVSALLERPNGNILAVIEEYASPAEPGQLVLAELSNRGQLIRQHSLGGPGAEVADALAATPDGGYVLAGEQSQAPGKDAQAWVVKLNADFTIAWQFSRGTPGRDRFNGLVVLPNGDVIAGGNRTQLLDDGKTRTETAWIVRLSADGKLIWAVDPEPDLSASIRSVALLESGEVAFAGFSKRSVPSGFDFDGWAGAISPDGALRWTRSIKLAGAEFFHQALPLDGGDLLALGASRADPHDYAPYLARFSADGARYRTQRVPGRDYRQVRAGVLKDGQITLAGVVRRGGVRSSDIWLHQRPFTLALPPG